MISQNFLIINVDILREARLSISRRACNGKLLSIIVANHVKGTVFIRYLCVIVQLLLPHSANSGGCVTVEGM